MYLGIPTQKSCARAWVAAASAIIETGDEGYNVVIDVADPITHDDKDNEVIALIDKFLKMQDQNPIITVSNTIFPQSLYDEHGSPEFYAISHRDFDKMSRETKLWGQYFDRMTRLPNADGGQINPLQDLIDKIKGNENRQTLYKAAYELAIYSPSSDRKRSYGGPCLSFLSFKRHAKLGLMLTAIYRNHYYITRCLGNLIGLGRLQAFVAKEAGIEMGSLTIISTHAELDTGKGWGIKDARELVQQAARMLRN
jgi:thymidylate synthase